MRNVILLLSVLISLTACHQRSLIDEKIDKFLKDPSLSIDDAIDRSGIGAMDPKMLDDEAYSFLSAPAKENMKTVMSKMSDLRKKEHEACGVTFALSDTDRENIKKIREDASMSKEAKAAKIKQIIEPLRPMMQKNRMAMKACKERKTAALMPLMEQGKALRHACLLMMPHAGKGKHKGKMGRNRLFGNIAALSAQQKTELNTKLISKACMDALAK